MTRLSPLNYTINTPSMPFNSPLFPFLLSPLPLLDGFSAMFSGICPLSHPDFLHSDTNEPLFFVPRKEDPLVFSPFERPVSSNSGSDTIANAPQDSPSQDKAIRSRCGSDELDKSNGKTLCSGSDGTTRIGLTEDRKRRRMLSNRESARRSRLRKEQHLKDLRTHLCRLKVGNRELMDRLRFAVRQAQFLTGQNECLRSEAVVLRQRLCDISQVLISRQLQQHLSAAAPICMTMH